MNKAGSPVIGELPGEFFVSFSPAVSDQAAKSNRQTVRGWKLLRTLKDEFRRFRSQPVTRAIAQINPIPRGWVNYFRIGQSNRCFGCVRNRSGLKVRRHVMRTREQSVPGWKRPTRHMLYDRPGSV